MTLQAYGIFVEDIMTVQITFAFDLLLIIRRYIGIQRLICTFSSMHGPVVNI